MPTHQTPVPKTESRHLIGCFWRHPHFFLCSNCSKIKGKSHLGCGRSAYIHLQTALRFVNVLFYCLWADFSSFYVFSIHMPGCDRNSTGCPWKQMAVYCHYDASHVPEQIV
ncbi:hypothetical protein GDO78_004670 [Eleutherodactylus coqui]|uniref:Uncharacterized protein n=1 Tax=Eleutherodactylus coqui TaxID=57060 RepID=A0A8J6K0Q3_ELECQ|nr:hypothetical protein GDO78_004670 [Eleutherodactylus coqui]